MASKYGKKFDNVLRELRKSCPVKAPVKVTVKDLKKQKLCGSCTAYVNDNGIISSFLIELDSSMSLSAAIDTLLHEWAHAMDKELNGLPTEPHRNSWGACYAKTWRAWLDMPEK